MAAGKIKVTEAAALLHVSDQFVRIGMQRGILPIGTALKMSTKWTYQIRDIGGGKMEKKIFYTLQQQKGVKGVRKECGYELEIATRKFYGYVSADQTVYIIDPRNGIAIMSCDTALICDDEILREEKEIECIKYVAKRAIERGILERLKEKEKKKSYKLTIKAFKAFVKAEILLEKQNAEVLKELKELAKEENT